MILQAKTGYWLTENFDVDYSERRFLQTISLANADEAQYWKEISNQEKEAIMAQGQLFDVKKLDYDYLNKVDTLLSGITESINTISLTAEQALEKKDYFPAWSDLTGKQVDPGFRFQYNGTLYEVIQQHTLSEEWVPGTGTESLYKVVQVEASGTKEDPIAWQPNMELFNGKYYTQNGILYLCNRDSGIALSYNLPELVGLYVTVVSQETGTEPEPEEPEPEEPAAEEGSKDNPIPYVYYQTVLMNGKYYTQDGVLYLCKRNGEAALPYNLPDLIPAGYVEVINE